MTPHNLLPMVSFKGIPKTGSCPALGLGHVLPIAPAKHRLVQWSVGKVQAMRRSFLVPIIRSAFWGFILGWPTLGPILGFSFRRPGVRGFEGEIRPPPILDTPGCQSFGRRRFFLVVVGWLIADSKSRTPIMLYTVPQQCPSLPFFGGRVPPLK